MKQIKKTLLLRNFMRKNTTDGLRDDHGIEVYNKLIKKIDTIPEVDVIYISLKGIDLVDSSFSREALIRTMKNYKTKKGFCLVDIDNDDCIDNFIGGAIKLNQPVVVYLNDELQIIGPSNPPGPTKGNQSTLKFVQSHEVTTATILSEKLGIKLNNASTKLKQLLEDGFILRQQDKSPSGGLEYLYYPIS